MKSSNTDMTTTRKELPTTPTITPSKTLINSLTHNPSDCYDKLEKMTLNPIGHPQSSSVTVPPELPYSPLKAENLLTLPRDWNLPSVHDFLADVSPQRLGDSDFRRSAPSKRILPGVESFDNVVPSTKALKIAAEFQDEISKLSHEDRNICLLKIASDWKAKETQITPISEGNHSAKTCVETTGKLYEMAREGPKQEGFGCPVCPKSFNRLSTLKYIHHSSINSTALIRYVETNISVDRKHRKRHDKPYGCTFAGCYGRFGSKADWKRHESMQHVHTQSFRCSLRRGIHIPCAKLFLREKDFVEHLKTVHRADYGTIQQQIATGHIGDNDTESRFRYWCGFCEEIKTVKKTGIDARNERFDHIDLHFQKSANINEWIPAEGRTQKGAEKERDKSRQKRIKRSFTDHLEENSKLLHDNGCGDGEPSSEEDTEAKPRPKSCRENEMPNSVSTQPFMNYCVSDYTLCHEHYFCLCNNMLIYRITVPLRGRTSDDIQRTLYKCRLSTLFLL